MPILALAVAVTLSIPQSKRFEQLQTTIDLTAPGSVLTEVVEVRGRTGGIILQNWTAKLGDSALKISLEALPRKSYSTLLGPADVVDIKEWNLTLDDQGRERAATFAFDETHAVPGAFGLLSYGWIGVGTQHEGTKPVATFIDFGVLTQDHGWSLWIEARPPLSSEQVAQLESTMGAMIQYNGPRLEPRWTDEEVDARWTADAPERVQKDRKLQVVRTDHYLILTVVGKGTAAEFGKKLEEAHELIRSIYPFEDVEGERLLPVYYFMGSDEYVDFCELKLGWSRQSASASGGVAFQDWYATYHQATTAPVHVHEATHQIFRNRLMLAGGGSWFQEGVAEYMSSSENDLNEIKRLVKDEKHNPLRDFFLVPTLLMSNPGERVTGESNAGLAYAQAASVIEYIRHSKETRTKFLPWIRAVGHTARGDVPAIERATVKTLGFGIDELEERWKAYYMQRKKVRDWHAPASKMSR